MVSTNYNWYWLCSRGCVFLKATLEFNLPEDQEEYLLYNSASTLYSILLDFDNYLRAEIKYNDKLSDKEYKVYDKIRDKLYEIMQDNDYSLQ